MACFIHVLGNQIPNVPVQGGEWVTPHTAGKGHRLSFLHGEVRSSQTCRWQTTIGYLQVRQGHVLAALIEAVQILSVGAGFSLLESLEPHDVAGARERITRQDQVRQVKVAEMSPGQTRQLVSCEIYVPQVAVFQKRFVSHKL